MISLCATAMKAAFVSGPKGRDEIAQGNALGRIAAKDSEALKGRDIGVSPFQGLMIFFPSRDPGRCPGLSHFGLSGLSRERCLTTFETRRDACAPFLKSEFPRIGNLRGRVFQALEIFGCGGVGAEVFAHV
jgi:hypothetical protein